MPPGQMQFTRIPEHRPIARPRRTDGAQRHFDDATLLRLGYAYEQSVDWRKI
jgi:hypothetical protein